MIFALAAVMHLQMSADTARPAAGQQSYSGRANQLSVPIPRLAADVAIDGSLDEPAWGQAVRLTGFSQYTPVDGLPAADSTTVLVWYSPTAIYFGIRAYEDHGAPTASLANRDQIFADDNIQVLLDTFHDRKHAVMFAVNPLGVQADGTVNEGANTNSGNFLSNAVGGREEADLSPDFVFQSRGHVTPWGYEVEIRIPFKSLRYQRGDPQRWGINVVRQVKHSGAEDSWAPARLTAASFLAQSGELTGLTGLHRGMVLDLNPEATRRQDGAPDTTGALVRDWNPVQLGGNLRLGLGNSLALGATLHPDFSQVESDAGQLAFDPRQALFFPEKRPFFLEGSELFAVPNNLIYTRRIVQPDAALKLTGNVGDVSLGVLSAVDQAGASASGRDNPVFNILRAQRPFGASRVGVAFTDREESGVYNRVADVDGRLVLGPITAISFQLAGSATSAGGTTIGAPLWSTGLRVAGRRYGLTAGFSGVSDKFQTTSGFIGRNGIVHSYVDPSYTIYGASGGMLQRLVLDVLFDGTWQYPRFFNGLHIQDQKLHLNGNAFLRGGWAVGAGYFLESFGYDPALYAAYRLEVPKAGGGLDTIPFTGQPTIGNSELLVQVSTPQWQHFSFSGFYLAFAHDEDFAEWASGKLHYAQGDLVWRPTDRVRTEFTYFWQQVNRRSDGSLVMVGRIPRLQVEYQVARPLFVRVVGQYVEQYTDSLRDESRTGAPILIATPTGVVRTSVQRSNVFHSDVLVAYQPVPGTTILAGYATDANDPTSFGFSRLAQTGDVLFVKLTWLFRM